MKTDDREYGGVGLVVARIETREVEQHWRESAHDAHHEIHCRVNRTMPVDLGLERIIHCDDSNWFVFRWNELGKIEDYGLAIFALAALRIGYVSENT